MKTKAFPGTVQEKLDRVQEKANDLALVLREARENAIRAHNEKFEAAGGCKRCRGRGWYVTWDTLDAMDGSYAEYAQCKESGCTEASRAASGIMLPMTKYDRQRGTRVGLDQVVEHQLIRPLEAALSKLNIELADLQAMSVPKRGRKVVVAKGRKHPIGMKGTVFWVGQTGYGLRAGFKADGEDEARWTNLDNLQCLA